MNALTEPIEPIHESDEVLREILAEAEIPPLLPALALPRLPPPPARPPARKPPPPPSEAADAAAMR